MRRCSITYAISAGRALDYRDDCLRRARRDRDKGYKQLAHEWVEAADGAQSIALDMLQRSRAALAYERAADKLETLRRLNR